MTEKKAGGGSNPKRIRNIGNYYNKKTRNLLRLKLVLIVDSRKPKKPLRILLLLFVTSLKTRIVTI